MYQRNGRLLPSVLMLLLAVLAALAWLLPNHNQPWTTFQSESWLVIIFLSVACVVLLREPLRIEMPVASVVAFLMVLLPWGQFLFGGIHSFGTAWINSIYLLGFALAIIVGWNWESRASGEAMDFLFLAITIASVVSVGLQVCQLLQIDGLDIWVLNGGQGRFSANLNQPNMLASLLLLGVIGVAWAYANEKLGAPASVLLVMWLLFGVQLTESRTAWLNMLALLIGFAAFWRTPRPKYLRLALIGFAVYAILVHFSIPVLNELFRSQEAASRGLYDAYRIAIWRESLSLLIQHPYFGYGWGQAQEAYLGADGLPDFGGALSHSHNIFIELLLNNGVLLGGLLLVFFAAQLWQFLRYIRIPNFIFPFSAFWVLFVHAQLELPLHYAYFLLPFGLILGVLSKKSGLSALLTIRKLFVVPALALTACVLVLTIHDCFEVERTVNTIRYGDKAHAKLLDDKPNLFVLTQWRERLEFANAEPQSPLTEEKYQWMKGVVVSTPSPFMYFRLAQNLALDGQSERAKYWLGVLCRASPEDYKEKLFAHWSELSVANSKYIEVNWKGCALH